MRLYKNLIGWPITQLQAVTPRCYRPMLALKPLVTTGSGGRRSRPNGVPLGADAEVGLDPLSERISFRSR